MHRIEELKEKLLDELADYSGHEKYSEDDAENIKNLSGAIDHICNILMGYEEMEDSEYSNRYDGGMSYARGGQGGNRGGSYRGGSYARGDGRGRTGNVRRDSRGRYSREGGYSRAADDMVEQLRDMMEDAPDQRTKQEIQRLIHKMEQM